MFSGRISEMVAKQIENKIAERGDLTSLSDSELSQLAIEFVGDAPPSHVPRETVIQILSQQPEITAWRAEVAATAKKAAQEKVSQVVANVDPRMAKMIKQQFGQWLQNSGLTTAEITSKIDTNSDGLLSRDELNNFIENLSGSQPPEWVSDTVISILDADGNGLIEVQELWTYLESIGFEKPVIVDPVLKEEITEEDFEEMLDEIEVAPVETKDEIILEESKNLSEITLEQPEIEQETPTPMVTTSIEQLIESLGSTRLSSEANSIIDASKPSSCSISIQRVERNLMVMDQYRGGMTIVGLLDNGPYTVAVLFEPEYNNIIANCEGKTAHFNGKLHDWSSGLRQAKLKGTDLQIK
ncbi:MAG: EF-hand domain-containing protein [Euryarchaeota archaeon]|nr:EF-hand domain-containing protein [Euryarchaeota archaeon]